jgi:hypothetical protein
LWGLKSHKPFIGAGNSLRAILPWMSKLSPAGRLIEASARAREAEARGDDARAGEEWRRFRLIRDAARDPDELLAEGIALSLQAAELASAR